MKATTKNQAERIAKAGAAKMTGQGYRIQRSRFTPGSFCVIKADGSNNLADTARTYCSCAFFAENKEFGTCKHLEFARAEDEFETRWTNYAAEAADAEHELADARY